MEPIPDDESKAALYLAFHLDERLYGVPVAGVREIIPMLEITPVPDAPATMEGVINLRGTIVPVIGLRRKLKLKERKPDEHFCIVVAEATSGLFGFLADKVIDCLEISEIAPASKAPAKISSNRRFIQGIGQYSGQIIILLNLENLFSTAEHKALENL